ncbi:MAG: peptidoglycan editing factor PgeF [Holosporaceae bacterium]|nr:peptidoglycan editing factor PgeF [Holosporaceae bacterium]
MLTNNRSAKIVSTIVDHGFYGRKYGKSIGFYASLNCSMFVGDDDASVFENLGIVKNEFRCRKLITLQQVHGNLCVTADLQTLSTIKADALITVESGVAIGILTADCAPILFVDRKNPIIGAAHAGWRGAVAGIVEATVEKMIKLGSKTNDIVAAIGPCIQRNSYEINNDFRRNFSDEDDCFFSINHKMYFDLPKYCYHRLIGAGLNANNIDVMAIDTYADPENYFSYRFAIKNTNGICGRNISVICLRTEYGNNSYQQHEDAR